MTTPRTIHVGPYRYQLVSNIDSDVTLDANDAVGLTDADRGIIAIHTDLTSDRVAATVLHEVIHACADLAGLGDNFTEEEWASRLAPVLLDVLRRNTNLLSILGV